jgi:hypothetical protein
LKNPFQINTKCYYVAINVFDIKGGISKFQIFIFLPILMQFSAKLSSLYAIKFILLFYCEKVSKRFPNSSYLVVFFPSNFDVVCFFELIVLRTSSSMLWISSFFQDKQSKGVSRILKSELFLFLF